MRNRNRLQAQVPIEADAYASLLEGKADLTLIGDALVETMGNAAAERNRRLFGPPRLVDAQDETEDVVTLCFVADTEPA